MAEVLEGEIRFEVVTEPRAADLLRGFDAGPTRYGKIVTGMVAELAQNRWGPGLTGIAVRVGDDTMGVCAWFPKPLPSPDLVLPDDVYIHTIGLGGSYRGKTLADGTWLSNALLKGALCQVAAETEGPMPASWTCVAPFNKKSHRLFAQHGYRTRRPTAGDIIRFRPGGIAPDLYLPEGASSLAVGSTGLEVSQGVGLSLSLD